MIKFRNLKRSSILYLDTCVLCLVSCILILVSCISCKRERNHPGYAYMDDMVHSYAYKYYSENKNFKDDKTAQYSVKGSIPTTGEIPFLYALSLDEQKRAGRELVNPIGNSTEDMKIGKEKFLLYCAICHGDKGKGDGIIARDKKFNKPVTSLVGDYVQNKPDGELFHTITLGSVSGFMGSHTMQLKPDDRWRVIKYIKTELKNK